MRAALIWLVCVCAGCKPGPQQPWSEAWLLEEGTRYLDDARFRRQALEESLQNPANIYSRQRLESYGLVNHGWDLLPVWTPRSVAVTSAIALALSKGASPRLDEKVPPLWDGRRPNTMAEWVALGRVVFFTYPLRAEPLVEFALGNPQRVTGLGLETFEGGYPGMVLFADIDGRARVGITCALCHTTVRQEKLVEGAARRAFDYGRLRTLYHSVTGVPVEQALLTRMAIWGPGRADVTEDLDEDPVAIPDLWGLRSQTALTQAGTIRHAHPAALAIRQETQLLQSNHQVIRPPRELAWALTLYLYSLEAPRSAAGSSPLHQRGKELFESDCRSCHSNAAWGGPPVRAEKVGTDSALALGTARGTGRYRTPALIAIGAAGPYLHHGAVPTLEALLSPERFNPSYRGSPLGPGPVPGHEFGTAMSTEDRAAVVAFLRTL